jgi:hypothetical protein
MRRSLAAILTVLFSWMLILPVFAPAFSSKLPACCLKSGRHHCMMRAMAASAYLQKSASRTLQAPGVSEPRPSGSGIRELPQLGAGSSTDNVATIDQKCPFSPQATVASHVGTCTAAPAAAVYAGIVSHPSGSPQTEAGYRVSFNRSRQKRGPPALFLNS